MLAHRDRGRHSDAGTPLKGQRISDTVQTCCATEPIIAVERKPKPRLDIVAQMTFEGANGIFHSVGFGVISEQATGYPGYNSIIPRDKVTIGRILKENGYSTSWFGKDHNTPAFSASQAGPFDQWPNGMGFDYFYGFVGGDANQWEPNLFRNTSEIYPYVGHPGWNLTTAMADDAIEYMKRVNAVSPEQPFFIYYVPGGTHAPHHPTPEWIKKISDMHLFDRGWDDLREQIFKNQKKLGVIPPDAKLTPWPSDLLKHWNQLTPDEQKMFIRQVDVFAAYAAYTDNEIGRVIQEVEDEGKLDNTLIIYIEGDNGTSSEGTLSDGYPVAPAVLRQVDVHIQQILEHSSRTRDSSTDMSGGPMASLRSVLDMLHQNTHPN